MEIFDKKVIRLCVYTRYNYQLRVQIKLNNEGKIDATEF